MSNQKTSPANPGAAPRVEMWTLDRLHPYANNPRRNDEAVPALAESIATFGFKVPIVARPDGEILAGHTRFKAALRLGLKEVPVLVADDLDDMKAKAYRLADNKVAEAAEWDMGKLEEELADLQDADFDMENFGFDEETEAEGGGKELIEMPSDNSFTQERDNKLQVMGRKYLITEEEGGRLVETFSQYAKIQSTTAGLLTKMIDAYENAQL